MEKPLIKEEQTESITRFLQALCPPGSRRSDTILPPSASLPLHGVFSHPTRRRQEMPGEMLGGTYLKQLCKTERGSGQAHVQCFIYLAPPCSFHKNAATWQNHQRPAFDQRPRGHQGTEGGIPEPWIQTLKSASSVGDGEDEHMMA